MRMVYYNLFFILIVLLVKYKTSWLPMFGIKYDSLFLCMFIIVHFLHFKILFYIYEIAENSLQRKFEFLCDQFAINNVSQDKIKDFREAMLIVFQKNQCDYHTDSLYSLVKNHHPTLQERLEAIA